MLYGRPNKRKREEEEGEGEAAKKKAKTEQALDFVPWIQTTDIKCIGGCGLFGGYSGFCSQCWPALSNEDKIRHTDEQKVLQVQRTQEREERLRKEKEELERAEKERQEKLEKEERELAEKMGHGECFKIDCLTDDASADNWGNGADYALFTIFPFLIA